jgi:hypothetical protein
MIKPTDFNRMWIVVAKGLQQHLADGKALTCSHEQVQFVLTLAENMEQARIVRDQLAKDPRPAYILPVEKAVQAALAAGASIAVRVLDGDLETIGEMRLSGGAADPLRTEHGRKDVESVLLSELRTGDFFAISERTLLGRNWVVYRALDDATDVQVDAQRTSSPKSQLTFTGENQVVYRLVDRDQLLRQLQWEDLPAAV